MTSNIQEISLENVMGDRFGRYSKYIIQERALPDIRDGLKPVQRRILFAMNQDGNTHDKAFRKSAKSVGNVMGNYHPHGDSSIYEAMVRMSQDWKLREPLIGMHGNNGSMDGDPPAAMRYTEARLSQIADELLQDIDKKTVDMVLNFDDTEYEPTVLPAHFPNLLVNGSTGISAGYATSIPTHNLKETINATVYLLEHPNASLEKLMTFIKGPDFPTGGIMQGLSGIKKAYETGKGRAILRAKTLIEPLKGGKQQIVITEIPYEVNKSNLVKRLDEVHLMKKVDGIVDVRDESDREGLRIVVELKKDANAEGILNYLFKNTDLQISYNFNMVAINNKRPELVGLMAILQAYIAHQKAVTTRRVQFDLAKAQAREHIVAGLIKALSILDQVITVIRSSENKKSAKNNLMEQFAFSEKQAEAIVSLQLYRLTNTDITALQSEAADLHQQIARFETILNDEQALTTCIKDDLKRIAKKYGTPRKTEIQAEIQSLEIETTVLVAQEDVQVLVSHEGYVKRSSLRSYAASIATDPNDNGLKEGDYPVLNLTANTLDHLYLFTNKGNVIYRPVHELFEARWKEIGEHLSQSVGLADDEHIVNAYCLPTLNEHVNFVIATKEGLIKQTSLADLQPGRTYKARASMFVKLKTATDEVVNVRLVTGADESHPQTKQVICLTNDGYALRYPLAEVSLFGARAAGIKAMNLKDDHLVQMLVVDEAAEIGLLTQRGTFKKLSVASIPLSNRGLRGVRVIKEVKSNPYEVIFSNQVNPDEVFAVLTKVLDDIIIEPSNYANSDLNAVGSTVINPKEVDAITGVFVKKVE